MDVMGGVPAAILDHEATSKLEAKFWEEGRGCGAKNGKVLGPEGLSGVALPFYQCYANFIQNFFF